MRQLIHVEWENGMATKAVVKGKAVVVKGKAVAVKGKAVAVKAPVVSAMTRLAARATAAGVAAGETVVREIMIPLNKIKFDLTQPRKAFHHLDGRVAAKDEEYIAGLATTIKTHGLLQAITVQETDDGNYLVVIGECRTRAHLLNNAQSIRAIVRNDLKSPSQRLLAQLVENVDRLDLTDDELAASILHLMKGDKENGMSPMTQSQIAANLGKSEGWITRFVRFGDEELQRTWVKTGIADSVENLYRLSILPTPMQIDIQRRVGLPEGHPERLEKPLSREVIDGYKKEVKMAQMRAKEPVVAPAIPVVPEPASGTPGNGVAPDDAIGQAFAQVAEAGRDGQQAAATAAAANEPGANGGVIKTGGYQLDDAARAAILGGTATAAAIGNGARETVQAPVNCRVAVSNLIALLDVLKSDEGLLSSMHGVICEMSIPGSLAKSIAGELMGMIVDDKEVPAILQVELGKLGKLG